MRHSDLAHQAALPRSFFQKNNWLGLQWKHSKDGHLQGTVDDLLQIGEEKKKISSISRAENCSKPYP
jgi:hypothetical protein